MERIELTQPEQQLLFALAEESRPYMHPDRPTPPNEIPADLRFRTRSAWDQVAAIHGLDVRRCNFQVDPATGHAWIMYRPEPPQPQP